MAMETKTEVKPQLIVGRVAAAERTIKPPFGEEDAVAIEVIVLKMAPGTGTKKPVFKFSAFSAVDFKVVDAFGKEILVDMKQAGSWNCYMLRTHVAWNVARDSEKGGLVSGGTGNCEYSKQELKPNAEAFWREFGRGKDDLEELSDMARGSDAGMNKGVAVTTGLQSFAAISFLMRKAKESGIKVGDAVAVLGTWKRTDNGMVLEGGQDSFITNCPAHLKELESFPTFDMPDSSSLVERVQMSKDLSKCSAAFCG